MRKWTFSLLLLLPILCSCGGGGAKISDPLAALLAREMAAVNSENISQVSDCVSTAYLDDCMTYTELINIWAAAFTDPTYRQTWTNLRVHSSSRNDQTGFGTITATLTITENDNGVVTTWEQLGTLQCIRENGVWREYGNQFCLAQRQGNAPLGALRSRR